MIRVLLFTFSVEKRFNLFDGYCHRESLGGMYQDNSMI